MHARLPMVNFKIKLSTYVLPLCVFIYVLLYCFKLFRNICINAKLVCISITYKQITKKLKEFCRIKIVWHWANIEKCTGTNSNEIRTLWMNLCQVEHSDLKKKNAAKWSVQRIVLYSRKGCNWMVTILGMVTVLP